MEEWSLSGNEKETLEANKSRTQEEVDLSESARKKLAADTDAKLLADTKFKPEQASKSEAELRTASKLPEASPQTRVKSLESPVLELSSSKLLKSDKSEAWLGVETKKGISNFAGTLTAGISGTMAWSLADKALGNTRYGLAAKLTAATLAGSLSRVAGKGSSELVLLEANDRTTGWSDLGWGAVDALAAVGAIKAEEAFTRSWKLSLGRSSGAHLSQEMMLDQGRKMLEGSLSQRLTHNTMRGIVGGGTGAFLWSTPHELANNFDKLNSLEGWKRTGDNIALNTVFGGAFGGVLYGGGTALFNARELASHARAGLMGKEGRYTLDIYHFNDGHSSILGNRSTLPQLAGKADSLRGSSERAGLSSLVLDLGDAHSGNAAAVVSNTGALEQRLIHQHLKVNASVPGNHSADTGLPGNARDVSQWISNMRELNSDLALAGREVQGVAANVQSVLDPHFIGQGGIYKPYRVFTDGKTGDKVALVGLVTDQLQGATPKLIDADLAIAAAKYGKLRISELAEKAATDPAAKQVMEKLAGNSALQKLMSAKSENTNLASVIDDLLEQTELKNLSQQARQNYKDWFALAGESPGTKLSELASKHGSSMKSLNELAAVHPDKTIADLHQIMISDPKLALEQSVQALKAEGVDKVVVLSHLGKANDLKLAQEGPRVAAIFGGHSHDLEPLPLYITNSQTGSDVLVSQAGSSYGWLGQARLVFNKDGSINRFFSSGKLHVIDESVKPMQSAAELVQSQMQKTPAGRQLLDQVGQRHPVQIASEISLDNIRGQKGTQTPLANMIASAFKEGGDKILPEVNAARVSQGLAPLGNQIDAVLIQSGGIRAGLPAGQIDELTVQTMFMNKPSITELSGEQIKKALSYGVHDFPAATKPSGIIGKTKEFLSAFGRDSSPLAHHDASGKNVIAGQLRFQVDRSLPTYARAINVEIWDQALNKYVPIDPAKQYTVMTVSHLLSRLGNTPMLPWARQRGISLSELGPEYWVLGKNMEADALKSMLKPSDLPQSSSRDFLLDYLKANSRDSQFNPAAGLFLSPMKDISPGSWIPALRPSWTALSSLGAVSAKDSGTK